MRTLTLLTIALPFALGCAGLRAAPAHSPVARAECAGGLECLPERGDTATHTRQMERGMTMAAQALALPPPPAPAESTPEDLRPFFASLDRWVERRTDVVEAARHELDAAAEENHRQRIVGGAIVGLMYEDVARELSHVQTPRELDGEPEIRDIYRATMEGRARRFVEHARRAYSACAQNAVQPSDMREWSRFCAAREDGLPMGSLASSGIASGETVVEVIAD